MARHDLPDGEFIDPGMGDPVSGVASGMAGVMGLFAVIFVGIVVFGIVVAVRKYRVLKDAGIDPLAVDATIAAKVIKSGALAPASTATPAKTLEERLRELDDLRARGVITEDEHREARAAALRG
jgi:uncharacterized membrane protein